MEQTERLARKQASGLRRTGAGRKGGVHRIDIERQEDRPGILPGNLEGHLGDPLKTPAIDIRQRDRGRTLVPGVADTRPRVDPATDADLDQVRWRRILDVRGVKERRAV